VRARRVVVLLVAVLAVYAVLIASRGITLLGDPRLAVKGLGIGVVLLPVLGVGLVGQELRFGRAAERVARRVEDHDHGRPPDATPDDELLPRRPSGRIDRAAADAVFERRRAEVEAAPDDWRGWVRLARAYGDAGDTARGRRAMRRAIELEQQERAAH
jgi:hypothetical protein